VARAFLGREKARSADVPQAQDVSDQIVHVLGSDYEVAHCRMRCARPHSKRCDRHAGRVGDAPERRSLLVWRSGVGPQHVVASGAEVFCIGPPFASIADIDNDGYVAGGLVWAQNSLFKIRQRLDFGARARASVRLR